tara:strand:- start:59 stop:688 length:630 start_codon:yes stop_codon:yes gene_type:complete
MDSMVAFSGGKDSVAISQYLLKKNIKPVHVCVLCKGLEYPKHIQYIKEYCNKYNIDLKIIYSKVNIDWLLKNTKYIFPFSSKIKGRFFQINQQSNIKKYSEKYNFKKVYFGRRLADGNSIKSEKYLLANKKIQSFPLRSWSDIKTNNFLKNIKLSPLYNTLRGKARGTHPINIANTYFDKGITEALSFIKLMDSQLYETAIMLSKQINK